MKRLLAYQPGTSWLHHLHPLAKAAWLVLCAVWLLTPQPWQVPLVVLSLSLAGLKTARIKFSRLRGLWAAVVTALFLLALNIIFSPFGNLSTGLSAGISVAARFLGIIFSTQLFVTTTDPGVFAYALMRAGLPSRAGFALINALRAVPFFEQDAVAIYNAQRARGAPYDQPGFIKRFFPLARDFFFPMLAAVIRRAEALTLAMEARAFGSVEQRTYARQNTWRAGDFVVLLFAGAGLAVTIIHFIRSAI